MGLISSPGRYEAVGSEIFDWKHEEAKPVNNTQTYYFAVYWIKDNKHPYNTLPHTDLEVIKNNIDKCNWTNVQYFKFEAKLPI